MRREEWDVCEKPWDAQGGLGCVGSTQDPWQGRVTWHTTSPRCHMCAQGVVAPRGDSSGISWQSCLGTSPATAARNTVTGRRRKPTSHLGRRLIPLPWVSTWHPAAP